MTDTSPLPTPSPPPARGLRSRVFQAGQWVLGGMVIGQVIRFGTNLILTRLLAPEAFGLVAVVTVMLAGLAMFSDLGVHRTVVQSAHGDDPDFLSTAWSVQIIRGGVLAALTLLMAGGLALGQHLGMFGAATVYGDPNLPAVMAFFSVAILTAGLESIRVEVARRHMKMNQLTQFDLASQALTALITIVLSLALRSVWGLVLGTLLGGVVRCLISHWRFPGAAQRWLLNRVHVRELMDNSRWIIPSSILGFIAINGDRLFLSSLITPTEFGVYSIAFLLATTLLTVTGILNNSVVFPALSEVARERRHDLGPALSKFQWMVDAVVVTGACLLVVAGPNIVRLVYDSRYHDAGWMLSILAVGLIGARYQMVESCFLAVGKPQFVMTANLLRLVALWGGIVGGHALDGLHGAIWGIALSPFATWPLVVWFKLSIGAFSWRSETMVIPAASAGALLGLLISLL